MSGAIQSVKAQLAPQVAQTIEMCLREHAINVPPHAGASHVPPGAATPQAGLLGGGFVSILTSQVLDNVVSVIGARVEREVLPPLDAALDAIVKAHPGLDLSGVHAAVAGLFAMLGVQQFSSSPAGSFAAPGKKPAPSGIDKRDYAQHSPFLTDPKTPTPMASTVPDGTQNPGDLPGS